MAKGPGNTPVAEKAADSEKTAKREAVPHEVTCKVEAALMAVERPIATVRLAELIDRASGKTITRAIDQLNAEYEQTRRSFRIEQVAGGWQILTLPEYAEVAGQFNRTRQQTRLSPAALETLAIIAYKQPLVRAEIESIRGVACGEVLRSLLERHLIKIVGRAEELGRPMLYGTTKSFLEVFGLANLKDLPQVEQLKVTGSEQPGR
ncbi:MAG: SMC-Scp complex subunit ScpB [Phycisphaeraceae bacterium]|nr:SMC-Scp complex subunit ScpB [Phycisphaeraceae bacterium]